MTLVLIPCAVCGRNIRAASEDFAEGGVEPSEVTCCYAHMLVLEERRGASDPRPDPRTNPEYWTE